MSLSNRSRGELGIARWSSGRYRRLPPAVLPLLLMLQFWPASTGRAHPHPGGSDGREGPALSDSMRKPAVSARRGGARGGAAANPVDRPVADGVGSAASIGPTVSMNTLGTAGYALEFDGATDWVRLATTASMMGAGWESSKTVSLWVRPMGTAAPCAGADRCDAVFGDRPRWWGISRGVIGDDDKIWLWNHDGSTKAIAVDYTVDQWTHVSLVHGDGVLRAFRNGVEVGSVASGPTRQPITGALPLLQIGGVINSSTSNFTFGGQIDEVAVWNRARTAEEVFHDMHRILAQSSPGLVAYYRMSNGVGRIVNDNSVNSWIGTLEDGGPGVWPSGRFARWVISSAPVTRPPVAYGQTVTTEEDTPVTITLSGSDPDGDPLTFHISGDPAHGLLSGTAPHLLYTPAADFHGTDRFRFRVNDGLLDSQDAEVTIVVTPVNDPPVAVDDAAVTLVGTPVVIQVLANDYDVDGDPLTVAAVGSASHGTVENLGYAVRYTPNPGFIGVDQFTYTVSDGQGGEATGTVTVTVRETNQAPVAHSQAVATETGAPVAIVLRGSDPDGDPLTFLLTSQTENGLLSGSAPNLLYTPETGFLGTDHFRFLVTDGLADSAEAQVTITVRPPNTPPVAVDDSAVTTQGKPVVIRVLENDRDEDGDPLTVAAVGSAAHGTVENLGHAVRYTPNPEFLGADRFSYTISDGRGGEASAWVTVTVTPELGLAGYALEFNGTTDYVRIGNTAAVMGESAWPSAKTVSVWVKATAPSGPPVRPESGELIAGNDRPRTFGISRALWDGEDRFWAFNVSATGVSSVGVAVTPGEWVQITLLHADGMLRIFRNGIEVDAIASGPTQTHGGVSVGSLYLGGSDSVRTPPWHMFKGRLDEVRFWNAAMDPDALLAVVYRPAAADHPKRRPWRRVPRERSSLAAYYRMSDGRGTALTDDGPYGNAAALLGGMGDHSWVTSGAFEGESNQAASDERFAVRDAGSAPGVARPPNREIAFRDTAARPRSSGGGGRTGAPMSGVRIAGLGVGLSPAAVDDRAATLRATPVVIPVLDNDSAADGEVLSVVSVGDALHGTVENQGVAVRYLPYPDFVGIDRFTYLVSDGAGRTASATVEVTVTDRLVLAEVGALPIPGEAWDAAVVDRWVYVASLAGGLHIVDVSDPLSPVEVGSHGTPGPTRAVRVVGKHAFLADGRGGLRILDVSEPSTPFELGWIDTPGEAWALAVDPPFAYVVDRSGGLLAVDVGDPAKPRPVGFAAVPGEATALELAGHFAYVADSDGALWVVDVSDPGNPAELGYRTFSDGLLGLSREESLLHVAAGRSGLRILDISSPAEIVEIGALESIGLVHGVGLTGGFALVAGEYGGLRVVDVFDPTRPVWTATVASIGRARAVAASAGYAYVAAREAGLRVIRVF